MKKLSEKDILQRFGYYYDIIQIIGDKEFDERITIDKIGIPRGIVQRAYKEMNEKNNKFMGNIIDYLQWISTNYFLLLVRKGHYGNSYSNATNQGDWMSGCSKTDLKIYEKLYANSSHLLSVASTYKKEFKNMMRLYKKNQAYIKDLVDRLEEFKVDKGELFYKHLEEIIYLSDTTKELVI